jgi:hypothetical protein
MGKHLKVTSFENRGSTPPFKEDEAAYGFVYFSDDRRVGYTSMRGVDPDATGGWGEVTLAHVGLARRFLADQGILPV